MKPNKITPYLPYRLLSACIHVKQYGLNKPLVKEVEFMAVSGFIEDDTAYKILLRPLNSIGDKIRSNYRKTGLIPMVEISKILGLEMSSGKISKFNDKIEISDNVNSVYFDLDTKEVIHKRNNRKVNISQESVLNIREFLYESHFDVNGLIESNEAYNLVELSERFELKIH